MNLVQRNAASTMRSTWRGLELCKRDNISVMRGTTYITELVSNNPIMVPATKRMGEIKGASDTLTKVLFK